MQERLTWRLGYKLQQHGIDIAAIDTLPNLLPKLALVCAGWLEDQAEDDLTRATLLDAASIRIKLRAAVAIPAPARSIRKLELGGGGNPAAPAKAAPAKKTI